MTTAELSLKRFTGRHLPWRFVGLLAGSLTVSVLLALAWPERSGFLSSAQAGDPPVTAPATAGGGFIDHSVLNDANLLPEPDPSPLSVAAYGD